MTLDALRSAARDRHLALLGAFHPSGADGAPDGCGTLLLLGPDEPRFWPAFTKSPEYRDGAADPMDRWSARVVGDWAGTLGARALFPFGGPPHLPFHSWALRTGRMHTSPVGFLVHDRAGLFVSFRAALALKPRLSLPESPPPPCPACAGRPCVTACPVAALTPEGYDVDACKAHVAAPEGIDCRRDGCRVRRACPVSAGFGRLPAQSEFHMAHFMGGSR